MEVAPATTSSTTETPAISEGFDVLAPMPGAVVRLLVSEGDEVGAGDAILVLEAMKMETEVKTERAGKVSSLSVSQGDTVASGDILATIS
jgi:biotin carboxyl carrier protein